MGLKKEFLLVDGYNIIFAWGLVKDDSEFALESARRSLIETLSDYKGSMDFEIIIVFDAHKVSGGVGSVEKHHNITVVYTKQAETADNYIEKTTHALIKNYRVKVATSDSLEQVIILSKGALRVSARELREDVEDTKKRLKDKFIQSRPIKNNMLLNNLDQKTIELLEKMRRER